MHFAICNFDWINVLVPRAFGMLAYRSCSLRCACDDCDCYLSYSLCFKPFRKSICHVIIVLVVLGFKRLFSRRYFDVMITRRHACAEQNPAPEGQGSWNGQESLPILVAGPYLLEACLGNKTKGNKRKHAPAEPLDSFTVMPRFRDQTIGLLPLETRTATSICS